MKFITFMDELSTLFSGVERFEPLFTLPLEFILDKRDNKTRYDWFRFVPQKHCAMSISPVYFNQSFAL